MEIKDQIRINNLRILQNKAESHIGTSKEKVIIRR